VDPAARPQLPAPVRTGDETEMLISCPYFCLERITVSASPAILDTHGQSFHAVTVIEGAMTVRTTGGQADMATHESVVIPACAGAYALIARESSRAQALVARVP
jgi:mannose-6-phosphate isomerase